MNMQISIWITTYDFSATMHPVQNMLVLEIPEYASHTSQITIIAHMRVL